MFHWLTFQFFKHFDIKNVDFFDRFFYDRFWSFLSFLLFRRWRRNWSVWIYRSCLKACYRLPCSYLPNLLRSPNHIFVLFWSPTHKQFTVVIVVTLRKLENRHHAIFVKEFSDFRLTFNSHLLIFNILIELFFFVKFFLFYL